MKSFADFSSEPAEPRSLKEYAEYLAGEVEELTDTVVLLSGRLDKVSATLDSHSHNQPVPVPVPLPMQVTDGGPNPDYRGD